MATIGSLVLELQANAAQFHQEMGKARDGLERTGRSFGGVERTAVRFAAQGLGAVVPAAEGFEHSIQRVIQSAMSAGGALRLLGQAGLVVGGTLAVAAGVQWLQDNLRNWREFGETVSQTLDRLKAEAEEQQKFAEARKRAVTLGLGLRQQEIQMETTLGQARATAAGDELGAAHEAFAGRLKLIEVERQQRERSIVESVASGMKRDELLTQSARIALNARLAANEEYAAKALKLQEDVKQKQTKAWLDETDVLREQLKSRLDARKAFETQLGQGAAGLGLTTSTAQGFAALRTIRESLGKAAADIAFQRREGWITETDMTQEREATRQRGMQALSALKEQFAGVAAVVDAVESTLSTLSVTNFGTQIEEGRVWVDRFVATTGELNTRIWELETRFNALPTDIDRALPELKKAQDEFVNLAWAIYAANQQLAVYSAASGG